MKKVRRIFSIAVSLLVMTVLMSGCMSLGQYSNTKQQGIFVPENDEKPEIPEKLNVDEKGVPTLSVYDHSLEEISQLEIETYIMGVVAGEMKNDWPLEALKAQAILARTFVLKFCEDKESKYDGADISTDVEEAQAYSRENINDNVKRAIEETRGLVMSDDGEYPYAWFHAHSGGMTELPSVALDFKGEDPDYLEPVSSGENEAAPESVRSWTAVFSKDEVIKAANGAGLNIESLDSIEAAEKGKSGRAATLAINGQKVSAPTFRIQIGANELKSTLIESIEIQSDEVIFKGRGYGHGVGMSQWGAYAMAEEGKTADQIVAYYFPDIDIVKMW